MNHEPPAVTATLGWRYHHIGIPHTQPHAHEHHVAHLGVHVAGFETSPYGIEWIRFEPHCNVPEIVKLFRTSPLPSTIWTKPSKVGRF